MINIPTLLLKLIPITCSKAPDHIYYLCLSQSSLSYPLTSSLQPYPPSSMAQGLRLPPGILQSRKIVCHLLTFCRPTQFTVNSERKIPWPISQVITSYRSKCDVPSPEISLTTSSMSFPLRLLFYYSSCLLELPIQFITERKLIRFFLERPG